MFGLLLSVAELAGAATLGYASMAPRSQLFGRTFTGTGPGSRQMAFTFDDGPNDPHTLRLLEVLAKHEVKATFFLIGKYVVRRPEIAQAIARAGHVIGNHTYNHPNLVFTLPSQLTWEIDACERALEEAVGEHSRLFRPPFGGRRPDVLRKARALGYEPVMWSVSGRDWRLNTADGVLRHLAMRIRGGDVILLHDGGHTHFGVDRSHSVGATDRLLSRCKQEGFEFVTVPEMMNGNLGEGQGSA